MADQTEKTADPESVVHTTPYSPPDEKNVGDMKQTRVDEDGELSVRSGTDLANAQLDPVKEKKLLLKLDWHYVPIIMFSYLTCFLDRGNIGNVKVAGMQADIGASTEQWSTAVSIFYATYVAFETPLAMLMKKVTPRIMLSAICVVWSLTTIFTGFVTSVGGLYASRLVLGACEAGLFPCLSLYISMVYRREEQAKRVSYLMSCAALSGAVGGLLAYGLLQMNGVAGKAGWRWVYIIEGLFSVVIAVWVWFGLPTDPATAYFLSDEEKWMMQVRQEQSRRYLGPEKFDWQEFRIEVRDLKLYISAAIQFCQDIMLYGFSTFLPAILDSMGYDTLESNALTVPVYVWGVISFTALAWWADRTTRFAPFLLGANSVSIIGYILLLAVEHNEAVRYFATYLCVVGCYLGSGINLAWLNVNVAPHHRRSTAIGIQQSIANTAGIVAGQVYRTSPYVLGNAFSLGAVCLAQLLILANTMYIKREISVKQRIAEGSQDKRKVTSGDRAVDYKYFY